LQATSQEQQRLNNDNVALPECFRSLRRQPSHMKALHAFKVAHAVITKLDSTSAAAKRLTYHINQGVLMTTQYKRTSITVGTSRIWQQDLRRQLLRRHHFTADMLSRPSRIHMWNGRRLLFSNGKVWRVGDFVLFRGYSTEINDPTRDEWFLEGNPKDLRPAKIRQLLTLSVIRADEDKYDHYNFVDLMFYEYVDLKNHPTYDEHARHSSGSPWLQDRDNSKYKRFELQPASFLVEHVMLYPDCDNPGILCYNTKLCSDLPFYAVHPLLFPPF
jgi:hypothetical protein